MSNEDDHMFRVWDEETHEYNTNAHITYVLDENGELMIADHTFYEEGVEYRCPRHECKVERCTGLQDHNEKLIYAEDLLHIVDPLPGVEFDEDMRVIWSNGCWYAQGKHGKQRLFELLQNHEVIVVGTVHNGEVHQ